LSACQHKNFTKAAKESGVSQLALTKAIQKLEEKLGGALFVRDTRQVYLTELGQVMRDHLARVDETREIAQLAARAMLAADHIEVNLGIMCSIGPARLGQTLVAFRQAHPSVRLILHDVWAERGYQLLSAGRLDCAIMGRHQAMPHQFESVGLYSEPMVVAMPSNHDLANKEEVKIKNLDNVAYVDRFQCEFREEIFTMIAENGISVNVILRSESEDWIQSIVQSDNGVTILPQYSIVSPNIVVRPLAEPLHRQVELVHMRDRPHHPVVVELGAFLADYRWPD
jgi:LysR family transcriptional regulator, hydrogen peroxide-inducible genes activator